MDKSLLELYNGTQDSLQTGENNPTPLMSGKEDDVPTAKQGAECNPGTAEPEALIPFSGGGSAVPDVTAEEALSELAEESIHTDVADDQPDLPVERLFAVEQSLSALNLAVERMGLQVLETHQAVGQITPSVSAISTAMRGYDDAVKTLKVSLAANQRNEQILHDKLDAVRKDEHFTTIRPFLEFMISQHMELVRSKQNYEKDRDAIIQESGESIYMEIINLHNDLLLSLENQMSIQGMEVISYLPGTDYLPLEQNIIGFTPTENSEENRKLSAARSQTYKYQDKILRKANVTCYKLSG